MNLRKREVRDEWIGSGSVKEKAEQSKEEEIGHLVFLVYAPTCMFAHQTHMHVSTKCMAC